MMAETHTFLDGIPLDDFPFTIPVHRGFDARMFTIRLGVQRYAEIKEAARKQAQADKPVPLSCEWNGQRVDVPVWIVKVNPVEQFEFDVVLMDRRFELLRRVNVLDVNVTYGAPNAHVQEDADSGTVPKRQRAYLSGSAKSDTVPYDLESAIKAFQDATEATYKADSPISAVAPLVLGPGVADYIRGRRVTDNRLIAGPNLLDAMELLLASHGIDLWVSPLGKFYLLLSRKNGETQDGIPDEFLNGVDWVNSPPAFASEIGESFVHPEKIVSWYLRYEEIAARTADVTEALPAKIEYRIENVFRTPRGEWVTLADLAAAFDTRLASEFDPIGEVSFPAGLLGSTTTFNALIAKWFWSTTWAGTRLQQTAYDTPNAIDMSEGLRVQLSKDIVATIQRHWRRTYRIYATGVLGRQLSTFISDIARGHYRDLDFGSIKSPDAPLDADQRNELTDEQVELLPLTYRSGKSVRCAWVDVFAHPIYPDAWKREKIRRELLSALFFDRSNASNVAPFDCQWIDRDQLIFDIVPEAGHNIADRIPGSILEGNRRRLINPNDAAGTDLDVLYRQAWAGAEGVAGTPYIIQNNEGIVEVLPQLDADLSMRVYFTGVLQYPPNSAERFFEVSVPGGAPEGGKGTWYLPVPADRFAIFSSLDRDVPLNLDALRKDAQQSADAFLARLSQLAPGSHYAHGVDVTNLIPDGAVEGYDIEYGTLGKATLLTRVSFGAYRKGEDAHIAAERAAREKAARDGVAK